MDMNINEENWLPIKGSKRYKISNFGRVSSYTKKGGTKIMKSSTCNTKGYERIGLNLDFNKRRTYSVHRLVAEAFIPNPLNKKEVNHIDECKTNNHVGNLEWVTPSENVWHSIETWRRKAKKKAIVKCDLEGNPLKYYISTMAVRADGYDDGTVSRCLRGLYKKNQSYGFLWKYHKDIVQSSQ